MFCSHLVTRNPSEKTVLSEMQDTIAEELNVKKVEFHDREDELVEYKAFEVALYDASQNDVTSAYEMTEGAVTIAGGPEITAHPSFYKDFDYTVSGEGEVSVPELISKILNTSEKSDKVIISQLPELSILHSPYLDGIIDPSEYGGALWELARGCPFKCAYCYESKGEKTVRLFPI